MKITKSAFLGQNSGMDMGGEANFSSSGGDPPSPPSLEETMQKNEVFHSGFLQ